MAETTLETACGKAVREAEGATELVQPEVIFCPVCRARAVAIRRPFKMGVKLVNGGACPCQIQADLEAAAASASPPPASVERLSNELAILHDMYARLEGEAGDQAHGIAFLKGEIRLMQANLHNGVFAAAGVCPTAMATRLEVVVAVAMPGVEASIKQHVRLLVEKHMVLADSGAQVIETLACAQQLRQDLHDLSDQFVAVLGKSDRAEQATKRHAELLFEQVDDLRSLIESDRVQYGRKDDLEAIRNEFADLAQEFSSFRRVIRRYKATVDGLAALDGRAKSLETSFRGFEDMVEERLVRLARLEEEVQTRESRIAELERLIYMQRDERSNNEIHELDHRLKELMESQHRHQQQHAGMPETMVLSTERHRLEQLRDVVRTMLSQSNSQSINRNVSSFLVTDSLPQAYAVALEEPEERATIIAVAELPEEFATVDACPWHGSDSETVATTCYHAQLCCCPHQAPAHIVDILRQIADSAHVDPLQATFPTVACGISAIFHVMARHGNHASLQEQGCRALCKLACNNDNNNATLVANGGITIVVNAMRQHGDHAGVQEQGCVALLKLARSDEHRITVAANGGIDAIFRAMQRHGFHSDVQEQGCAALRVLARNRENKMTIAANDGIDLIVHTMQRHGAHAGVQEQGCGALCNLALNADNQRTIAANGGIDAIINAMQRHGDNAGLQEYGNMALRNLARNSENQVIIAANGGISTIVKAMTLHGAHAGVQEQGCQALCKLSCNSDSRMTIATTGGIIAIVNAMQQLGDKAGVQESGCTALSNLSCNADNKVTIAANGGIEAIVNAMQRHSAHVDVKKHGDLALKNLAERNRKNRALIADAQIAAAQKPR
jgi:phage gp16-like protein